MILRRCVALAILVALGGCAGRSSAPDDLRPAEIADRGAIASAMNELYPTDLRAAGIGGRALARFVVQTDGTTTDIEIVASSGYDSLDRATVEVVRRYELASGYAEWNAGEPAGGITHSVDGVARRQCMGPVGGGGGRSARRLRCAQAARA